MANLPEPPKCIRNHTVIFLVHLYFFFDMSYTFLLLNTLPDSTCYIFWAWERHKQDTGLCRVEKLFIFILFIYCFFFYFLSYLYNFAGHYSHAFLGAPFICLCPALLLVKNYQNEHQRSCEEVGLRSDR